MLSKPAAIILGLINERPLNAYEITKMLNVMQIKSWFRIADSTVYTTIKNLEKKELVTGIIKKEGNMPDKTIYSLTPNGRETLFHTLRQSILKFDYDTTVFSIASFFLYAFELEERCLLLNKRLTILKEYENGIELQVDIMKHSYDSPLHIANVQRCLELVRAEIKGTQSILENCEQKE